jgi:hypothetical protein
MPTPLDPKTTQGPEHIERLVGALLAEQPPRRAPRNLQSRVLAEIERREALPWWRNSFLHWPLAVRMLFILASLGVVKLAMSGVATLIGSVQSEPVVETLTRPLSWAERIADTFSRFVSVGSALIDATPATWIYAGIALAGTLYIALLVLGATAYRTLYVNK